MGHISENKLSKHKISITFILLLAVYPVIIIILLSALSHPLMFGFFVPVIVEECDLLTIFIQYFPMRCPSIVPVICRFKSSLRFRIDHNQRASVTLSETEEDSFVLFILDFLNIIVI